MQLGEVFLLGKKSSFAFYLLTKSTGFLYQYWFFVSRDLRNLVSTFSFGEDNLASLRI